VDIARPEFKLQKRRKQIVIGAVALVVLVGLTIGVSKLKPAAPSVERSTVWTDAVKQGPMLRQVRGNGTLVPQITRWVPAPADGRVEKILVEAGVEVRSDQVIAELSNPQMEQQALDSDFQVKTAEADEQNLKVRLASETMAQQAAIATINAEYSQAKLQLDSDESLGKQGLVPDLTLKISRVKVKDIANRLKVEQERLNIGAQSTKAQLNAQRSRTEQLRVLAKLKRSQVDALKVRAGINGVLVDLPLQVGQHVLPGAMLAKVVEPNHLMATIKIAETQARDVQIGEPASVDTHNGVVAGTVMRGDPAVQNGTVTVDVKITGELP